MPRRNLFTLVAVVIVALLCYQRVQKTPYGRVLANAIDTIEHRYLEPVQASKLFENAMKGLVGQLDENSAYITPAAVRRFHETIDMQFDGLGIELALDPETKRIMVLSPLAGSPAARAGVMAGDRILRIGPDSTQGMSLGDVVGLLRGKPGEPVTLTVLHQGQQEPVEISIVRGKIHVDTVRGDSRNADGTWDYFLAGRDRIGYVRILCFTDKTAEELQQALDWLSAHDMQGLALDLRDNPGGYVDAAIDVCDLLIPSGVVVTVRRRGGHVSRTYTASGQGQFTDFPLAVLINENTASAAEIVAACLQDQHRATVFGCRSYGKGTIQEIIDLEPDCGAMKFTTASYWRPNGQRIHRAQNVGENVDWGVSPDEGRAVALSDDQQNRWRLWRARRDGFQPAEKNGDESFVDRPLAEAVEYLEKEATETP